MFARQLTSVLIAATLMLAARVQADERAYEKALASTCFIVAPRGENKVDIGTGVLIDATHVVTAAHVVGNSKTVFLFAPSFNEKGRPITDRTYYLKNLKKLSVSATVVSKNDKTDLAILQLKQTPAGMKSAALAAKGATPGQAIFSIGNSGDTDDGLWRYRDGSVRQACFKKMDDVQAEVIQTTIPSDGGDSGGPVFNNNVELVGITHGHKGQTGYCIDISEVRTILTSVPSARPTIASNTAKPTAPSTTTPSPAAPSTLYKWPLTNTNTNPAPLKPWNEWPASNTPSTDWTLPTVPAPAPVAAATIDGCRIEHNATALNTPGLNLHVKASLDNAKGHECEVIISLRDQNGQWVRDRNGKVVQIITIIQPGYDQTTYGHINDNLVVFVPYSKIDANLGRGVRNYGFAISIWDRQTNGWITTSGYPVTVTER